MKIFIIFYLSLLSFVMTKYSTQRVMMLLRSKARLRSSLCVVVTIAVTMDINYASFFFFFDGSLSYWQK
ncbi:hypothetical protein AB4K20DRAFT_1913678 [Rhizopus microsporus]